MNVFVTIWNRHGWAIPLCEDFTKAGLTVILIDNDSTYPPCVEWLNSCPYQVLRMYRNCGAWAFFTTSLYQKYKKDRYFMISDSDQDISQLPSDWVDVLMKGFDHTIGREWKSGLSQKIDDLPDNIYANDIRGYEQMFYSNKIEGGYYRAWMDLGIAIYDREKRGENPIKEEEWYHAVRSPLPYASRHLDWYATPETLREEDKYYLTVKGENHQGWLFNLRNKFHLIP